MLTQAELQAQLHYSPETGIFTRLISNHHLVKVGEIAGSPNNRGYINISINHKLYSAHRLAWLYTYGEWPTSIDHINNNKLDNRLCNLRQVTHQQNNFNSSIRKNNKTKIKGVSWNKKSNKWIVQIQANYIKTHICVTNDFFEACCQAISFRKKLHGDYANNG